MIKEKFGWTNKEYYDISSSAYWIPRLFSLLFSHCPSQHYSRENPVSAPSVTPNLVRFVFVYHVPQATQFTFIKGLVTKKIARTLPSPEAVLPPPQQSEVITKIDFPKNLTHGAALRAPELRYKFTDSVAMM